MDLLVIAAVVLGFGLVIQLLSNAKGVTPQRRAFLDAWSDFAAKGGGVFTPGDPRSGPADTIRGTRDDVAYVLTMREVPDGDGEGTTEFTTVEAKALEPRPGTISAYPTGFLGKLSVGLGAQDVAVGDAAFDERFLVKASNEEEARAILDAPACRALLALPGRVSFSYTHGDVSVQWSAAERDPRVLRTACDLVVAMCRWKRPPGTYR